MRSPASIVDDIRGELSDLEDHFAESQDEIDALKVRIEELARENSNLRDTIDELESHIANLESDLGEAQESSTSDMEMK
jgi:chromosome segregation ATPase